MDAPVKKMTLRDHRSVALTALCEKHFTAENRRDADDETAGAGRHWTDGTGYDKQLTCRVCGAS